jgi:hypothetical protein
MSIPGPMLEAALAEPGRTASPGRFAHRAGFPISGHAGVRFKRAPGELVDAASDGVLSCRSHA